MPRATRHEMAALGAELGRSTDDIYNVDGGTYPLFQVEVRWQGQTPTPLIVSS